MKKIPAIPSKQQAPGFPAKLGRSMQPQGCQRQLKVKGEIRQEIGNGHATTRLELHMASPMLSYEVRYVSGLIRKGTFVSEKRFIELHVEENAQLPH